jgi:hypothetical protein
MMRYLVVLVGLVLALRPAAVPAETTGSIAGFVRDERSGTPIAGARVVARSPAQVAATTTGPDGFYVMLDLVPGRYLVSTTRSDYQPKNLLSRVGAGEQTLTRVSITRDLSEPTRGPRSDPTQWALGFGVSEDVYRLDSSTNPLFDNSTRISDLLLFVP